MIYLDNAATSYPKPESVINAMVYAQKYVGANAGRGGAGPGIERSVR